MRFCSFVFILIALLACNDKSIKPAVKLKKTSVFLNNYEAEKVEGFSIKAENLNKSDSTNKFEHLETYDLYSSTFENNVPAGFENQNVEMEWSIKFRSPKGETAKVNISIKNGENETVHWESNPLTSTNDGWEIATGTMLIPVFRKDFVIKAYCWNPKKIEVDIDDFQFIFSEKEFTSFVKAPVEAFNQNENKTQLNIGPFENALLLLETDKESMILDMEAQSSTDSSLILKHDNNDLTTNITILKSGNEINYSTKTTFKQPIKIERLALVFKVKGEFDELYRSNRLISTDLPKNQMWLEKQGFKVITDSSNWFCYGNSNLSSYQVEASKKLLIVNIDYEQDHPLLYFPELDTIINEHINISANEYQKEAILTSSFNVYESPKIKTIPRFLTTRNGAQSAILWTEHADYSDLRLHRATYFGSEKITQKSEATGGFSFYNIPVTKSVFYTTNDTLGNDDHQESKLKSASASITKSKEFSDLLDSLHADGNEICLHTPDFFTTNKNTMDSALEYVTKWYGSNAWIDHGYNNGHTDNREDFMCDGLNSYAFDLWEKYNVKYFWNGYFEDVYPQEEFRFRESIMTPYPGFGEQLPYPLFWQNKKAGDNMYSWRTNSVFYPTTTLWKYIYKAEKIKRFVDSYGVNFEHIYPAHAAHDFFWTYNKDSVLVAREEFNNALKRLNIYRDNAQLEFPTITNYFDYQLAIQKVTYTITNGQVILKNTTNENLQGVTMVILKEGLSEAFCAQFPNNRENGKDLVFWFDLKAQETLEIKL